MRRSVALILGAAACSVPPPRQALVEVALEAATSAALARLEVDALEADGEVRGRGAVLSLDADYFRDGRASFGVIPDVRGELLLRFRGYGADQALRFEQQFAATTRSHGVTHLSFTFRDACLDHIPCDLMYCASAAGAGACASPGQTKQCLLGTVLDCGACGAACNMSRTSLVACVDGDCRGSCEHGYGDCDRDLRTNGCEVPLDRDPEHCGGCDRPPCPFGGCVNGTCTRYCDAFTPQSLPVTTRTLPPNRLLGSLVHVDGEGYLAALGVSLPTGPEFADTHFRLALYENDPKGDTPMHLVDQTSEMSVRGLERDRSGLVSECGGLEMRVPNHVRITQQAYWLFAIASAPLEVYARPIDVRTKSSIDDVDYATLDQMPAYPHLPSSLKDTANLDPKVYLVRTPLEE